jgi:hypothetical protein
VEPGGVYIVEGVSTSYWSHKGGGVRVSGTSIEFFKTLVDLANCIDAYDRRALNHQEAYYCLWVDHVRFYDGVVMIFKRKTPRKDFATRVNMGYEIPASRADGPSILYEHSLLGFFHSGRNMGLPEDQREPRPQLPRSNHMQYEAEDSVNGDVAAEAEAGEGGMLEFSFRFGYEPPGHQGHSVIAPISLFPATGTWTEMECEKAMRFTYNYCIENSFTSFTSACPDVILKLLVDNVNQNAGTEFVLYDSVMLHPFEVDARHVPLGF